MVDAFYLRGTAHFFSGRFDLAIGDCTRAIELDPTHAMTYALRGEAEAKSGDISGAAADFDRALALAGDADEIDEIQEIRARAGLAAG